MTTITVPADDLSATVARVADLERELSHAREGERLIRQQRDIADERLRVAEKTIDVLRDRCRQLERTVDELRAELDSE